MHVGEAAAIGVEGQFAAGGGVTLGDERAGLAEHHMGGRRGACRWLRIGAS